MEQYIRQIMYPGVGEEGQARLAAAKVCIVGMGGLGCPVLLYLVGAGLGEIHCVDFDQVELHNLPRQILFTAKDLGRNKAEVAAERAKEQNPLVGITYSAVRIDESTITETMKGFDLIVDASDNLDARDCISRYCCKENKVHFFASLYKSQGQFCVFNAERKAESAQHYFEWFGNEQGLASPACAETGMLGPIAGILGMHQALLVLRYILDSRNIDSSCMYLLDLQEFKYSKWKLTKRKVQIESSRQSQTIPENAKKIYLLDEGELCPEKEGLDGCIAFYELDAFLERQEPSSVLVFLCKKGQKSQYAQRLWDSRRQK